MEGSWLSTETAYSPTDALAGLGWKFKATDSNAKPPLLTALAPFSITALTRVKDGFWSCVVCSYCNCDALNCALNKSIAEMLRRLIR